MKKKLSILIKHKTRPYKIFFCGKRLNKISQNKRLFIQSIGHGTIYKIRCLNQVFERRQTKDFKRGKNNS